MEMRCITVVGGGASGTLLAVNLAELASGPVSVALVEKRSSLGRGVAYSTGHDQHFLNVPAAKMSAFPDRPGHFLEWLDSRGLGYGDLDFVPRRLYGDYLSSLLEDARRSSASCRIDLIDDEAVGLNDEGGAMQVVLKSGRGIVSDRVVLAFGNALPPHPNVPDLEFTDSPRYIRDIWREGSLDSIDRNTSVLIIGTGLSMVDMVIRLESLGHCGPITAVSTRGILPAVHELGHTYPDFRSELLGKQRITDLHRVVRRHIENAAANGSNWRAVIDSLRPITQQLWQQLPLAERRYFMQHLSRYWNAARHRMPPKAAERISSMIRTGRLRIIKGRLKNIRCEDGLFRVDLRYFGAPEVLRADTLINCIASEANFARIENELVQNLLASGHIRCDPLALGLDALPNGSIIGKNGERSDRLFTLGTALKGILWESTAIPEIRVQARELAAELLS